MKNQSYKLVVHAPLTHSDVVREAIGNAGGGKIGNYTHCSFSVRGVGRFKPSEGASPHVGEVGKFEEVEEESIEVIVEESFVQAVIAAIRSVHPYEEPAIEVVALTPYN